MILQRRISIAFVLTNVVIAVSVVIAAWVIQNNIRLHNEQEALRAQGLLWQEIVTRQADKMGTAFLSISRDKTIKQALDRRDYDLLKDNLETSYNLLSSSNILTKLEVTDGLGNVVFSMPTESNGGSRNSITNLVLKNAKEAQGLELDDDNEPVIVYAYPLTKRGRLIGSVTFSKNLQTTANNFKKIEGSDVFVFGIDGKYYNGTNPDLINRLNMGLPHSGSEPTQYIKLQNNIYKTNVQPIKNSNSKDIGYLLSISDYTLWYNARQNSLIVVSACVVAIILLTLLIAGFYLKKSFTSLNSYIALIDNIDSHDLTATADNKIITKESTSQPLPIE